MNIFALDQNPRVAAEMACDKHVVKMIVESAQLLSTAIWKTANFDGITPESGPLKLTHENHPSAVWTRESKANYNWLMEHLFHLCAEYTKRYGKVHKYDNRDYWHWFRTGIFNIPSGDLTEFPQCMPDQYKVAGDSVTAYRNYYIGDKSSFAKWKQGNEPDWYLKAMIDKVKEKEKDI